jgi:hypothetical protein
MDYSDYLARNLFRYKTIRILGKPNLFLRILLKRYDMTEINNKGGVGAEYLVRECSSVGGLSQWY